MSKWRKKPLVVEAVQWVGQDIEGCTIQTRAGQTVLMVPTLNGEVPAQLGEFIITGVRGELYPCDQVVFYQTYDPVIPEDDVIDSPFILRWITNVIDAMLHYIPQRKEQ
jgi:hypothetical protein